MEKGHKEVAEVLLTHGADVNMSDKVPPRPSLLLQPEYSVSLSMHPSAALIQTRRPPAVRISGGSGGCEAGD